MTSRNSSGLSAGAPAPGRDLVKKHGRPGGLHAMENGFAIIGYGKLGGIELGYGSDLDLVFIHNAAPNSMTDGQRSVAADVFYARLAQRMIHILTTRTASGQLYEVDMRLRPNGKSGMLVTPINAFRSYQEKDAWTWEHQALVRARGIGGDRSVIDAFEAIRNAIVQRERDGRERQRHRVRQHVARVRQQRERTGQEAPDDLDNHERAGQHQGDDHGRRVPEARKGLLFRNDASQQGHEKRDECHEIVSPATPDEEDEHKGA